MRMPGRLRLHRRRRIVVGCFAPLIPSLALLALSLAAGPALAAERAAALAADRALTDADVTRWLPRLRAEAAAFTKAVGEGREAIASVTSEMERREALLADMASGKTDIAVWLRANAAQVFIPPGAIYGAECSRALTEEARSPEALFTFGKESPYRDLLRRAAAGDEAARDELYRLRGEEEQGPRSAAKQAITDFVAGIESLYRDRGYVDDEGPQLSVMTRILLSPDRSVTVFISEANYYCGLLPRGVPAACSELPTGPILEIKYTGDLLHPAAEGAPAEKPAGAATTGKAPPAAGGAAAAKAPAPEEKPDPDYERVKEALLLARIDADNPSALEIQIPDDAPAEAKAELRALAAELAVRKENVRVYKRHETELGPLLKALCQLSEQ